MTDAIGMRDMLSQYMWLRQPSAGLFELTNPHRSVWRREKPEILQIANLANVNFKRRPLLFVHGMAFRSPEEVFTDYLAPFERQARIFYKDERQDFQVFFVHWDSYIFSEQAQNWIDRIGGGWGEALLKIVAMPFLGTFIEQLEARAQQSAGIIQPMMREWIVSSDAPRPWVISHSLGAYLWSHIVATHVRESYGCQKFGNWWNLQAAVLPNSYGRGGEFAEVEAIYRGSDNSRMTLWYSRRDFVLSTFYRMAKNMAAAGQIGMWGATRICHRDVTDTAREAHGLQMLRRDAGSFFDRVGQLIYQDARFTNAHI